MKMKAKQRGTISSFILNGFYNSVTNNVEYHWARVIVVVYRELFLSSLDIREAENEHQNEGSEALERSHRRAIV